MNPHKISQGIRLRNIVSLAWGSQPGGCDQGLQPGSRDQGIWDQMGECLSWASFMLYASETEVSRQALQVPVILLSLV